MRNFLSLHLYQQKRHHFISSYNLVNSKAVLESSQQWGDFFMEKCISFRQIIDPVFVFL